MALLPTEDGALEALTLERLARCRCALALPVTVADSRKTTRLELRAWPGLATTGIRLRPVLNALGESPRSG